MSRSPINRLQILLKKTREYKKKLHSENGEQYYNSDEAEDLRLDLGKRYKELEDLILSANNNEHLIVSLSGISFDVFKSVYLGSNYMASCETIDHAIHEINNAIAYHNPKRKENKRFLDKNTNNKQNKNSSAVNITNSHNNQFNIAGDSEKINQTNNSDKNKREILSKVFWYAIVPILVGVTIGIILYYFNLN